MVKDDSNLALQTFAAGAVGAVGGTLLTNAVKGYRYSRSLGYSDDLDAMLKFNRHTGIPGSNGPPLKKSLKAFQEDALSHGLNEGQVDELLGDMEGDDELARYLMTDEGRLRAWEVLDDAGAVAMKTDVNWLTKVDNWTQAGYPANQINKAVGEIANNAALKAAFEADEVVFDAWKWIDDGIPTLPQGQPGTYINYLKRKTIYLNQATQGGGPIKYYRVQQAGPNGPEEILSLDGNGNVTFGSSSNDWLNFSTDNIDHARHFKDIDPANRYII